MLPSQWETFKRAARLEHMDQIPMALIIDSPWMPQSLPELISKVEPSYPKEALQAGITGLVLVSLQVDADGRPSHVQIIRGLGHGLDEKAVEAVLQWQFRPGRYHGRAVAVGALKVAVSFRGQ